MRTIIPAIVVVVLLCLCVQWQVDCWLYFRESERQMSEAAVTRGARAATQPTTQPAPLPRGVQLDR